MSSPTARGSPAIKNNVAAERRSKPRIECAYPAVVRGLEPSGKRFEESAVLANLSACGLYLRLNRPVEPGRELTVLIRLSNAPRDEAKLSSIATRGVVVRSELQPDGRCGLALKFERHHFL